MVGIGGVGMEALARLLMDLGCQVTGSDLERSAAVDKLAVDGVAVSCGHRTSNVEEGNLDLVVYTAAISDDNAELVAARRLNIKTMSRARLLGKLGRSFRTVAVAGTHGKTTTASMLADILRESGSDPSRVIGGRRNGRAIAGLGSDVVTTGGFPTEGVLVVEADEYDRSFHHLSPHMAVITNIEAEHLEDTYCDEGEVIEAFAEFAARVDHDGFVLLNGDDAGCQALMNSIDTNVSTFGTGAANSLRATDVVLESGGSKFSLFEGEAFLGGVTLPAPGRHNVMNATAASSAALSLRVCFPAIQSGLATFSGVERRFQHKGEVDGIAIIEDYAHHPTEVTAAIAAARSSDRRVVVAFQPHLFTRTRLFLRQFAEALAAADLVFVTAVYGSRESPAQGDSADSICAAMRGKGYAAVSYVPEKSDLPSAIRGACRPGDQVLFLGAGDIGEVAEEMIFAPSPDGEPARLDGVSE